MAGNKVKFAYVTTGSLMPTYPDADTVYFLEEAKEIRVGSQLFANVDENAVDMDTLATILESYTVKNVEITGSGDTVANVSFNEATGKVTFTKGNLPSLSKGVPGPSPTIQLNTGDTFEVVTDTAVSGHTITDGKTKFKLPVQINNLMIATSGNKIIFTLVYSDGTTRDIEYTGLGSAAFAAASDFATAAQGVKADAAMPAVNGTATDALVTLKRDPVNDLEAATKGYVDRSIEAASSNTNFLGTSETTITDGGSEAPTIGGRVIPVNTLNKGDWVVYDGSQFIWDGTKWSEYGGSKHSVPNTRRVDAGEGLLGGGSLVEDISISHPTKFDSQVIDTLTDDLVVVGAISYDKFGHLISVGKKDLATRVNALITPVATAVNSLADNLANNYYDKTGTDDRIAAMVPPLVDDELGDKVSTDTEFQDMMNDVFGPG